MTQTIDPKPTSQPAPSALDNEVRPSRFAALRWGLFVTAFLIAQIYLGYSAVKYANSDGGAQPIEGAEIEVAKSFEALSAPRPNAHVESKDAR